MKKNIAIFLSFLFLTLQSAKAEVGVGITGAFHMLDASGTETTRDSKEKNTGEKTSDVLIPELFIETTGDNGVTIGFSYIPTRDLGSKSRSDSNSEGDTGTYKADAELDNVFQFYLDYPVADVAGANVYVKAGLQHATITTLESLNSGSTYPDEDVMGFTLGIGAKGDLPYANTYYKVDLTYTDFEDYEASSNNNKVEAELEDIAAKFSIGYRF